MMSHISYRKTKNAFYQKVMKPSLLDMFIYKQNEAVTCIELYFAYISNKRYAFIKLANYFCILLLLL